MVQDTDRALSKEAIEEFKQIYFEEFKEELTDDEAQVIAQRLIRFFYVLTVD